MSISSINRKRLWAKSGNRCAICRLELVQNNVEGNFIIIGEECHIISSKKDGPRGGEQLLHEKFDEYENLILLCANDHKIIDTLTDIYSVEKLVLFKHMHEEWVKTTLDLDPTTFTNSKFKISSLKRIETGYELMKLIDGAHAFIFENDELKTNREAEIIPPLFDLLKDYGEVIDDMSFTDKAKAGLDLNQSLEDISSIGFILYGIRRNVNLKNQLNNNLGKWDMTTIFAARNDNPGIVEKYLIVQIPDTYKFRI